MNYTQAIQNPLGVTVFGSAVLRVEPDIASLNFTVSRLEQHPEGVNKIHADFRTTRLKELRADARRRAVFAAREKAEVYCEAAGVTLGSVIHIEDVNPDQLFRGHEQNQSILRSAVLEDGSMRAFNPGNIAVNGAVIVTFALAD